jgi:hypothetical protein
MVGSRRLVLGAALLAPLAAYPVLVGNPMLGIGLSILAVAVYVAARSPGYPVALWALPGIVIGLLGSDPFPNKSIAFFLTGWVALGLALAVLHDTKALPFRAIVTPPVLLSIGIAVLMVARLGSSPALDYGAFKLQLFLAQNLVLLVAGIVIARRGVDFDRYIGLLLVVSFLGAVVVMHGLVAHDRSSRASAAASRSSRARRRSRSAARPRRASSSARTSSSSPAPSGGRRLPSPRFPRSL